MTISRTSKDSDPRFEGEHYHFEWLMVISGDGYYGVPIASKVLKQQLELAIWDNEVFDEIYYTYKAPLDIRVSGEVGNGKTTLRYEGYVTTEDGETIDYKNEKVFEVEFVKPDELFNNNRLGSRLFGIF